MLGAAALSARDLVLGEVLRELVVVHAASFGGASAASASASSSSGSVEAAASADFLRSYELGVQLLRAAGLVVPAAVDAATGGGHLYATCCRFRQLAQPALSASAAAAAGVNIQAACVEEAVLVQAPLLALRACLVQLLEEWPEHPGLLQVRLGMGAGLHSPVAIAILFAPAAPAGVLNIQLTLLDAPSLHPLLQLSAVIDRLLGMPVTAPLKAMLTGVELLLAKGQVRLGCWLCCCLPRCAALGAALSSCATDLVCCPLPLDSCKPAASLRSCTPSRRRGRRLPPATYRWRRSWRRCRPWRPAGGAWSWLPGAAFWRARGSAARRWHTRCVHWWRGGVRCLSPMRLT